MVLPLSGAISLLDIQTEFGGVAPTSLSEYYRGGAYVINIADNNNIPTAGAISLQDFYGAVTSVGFGISLLQTGNVPTSGAAIVVTPIRTDPRRNILVIHIRQSGSTGLQPAPAATIGGVLGSVITALNSTAFDDGHAITVTSRVVKTGTTVSVDFGAPDGTYAVYEMYGISNVASAVTAVASARNTSGSSASLAATSVTVATSATNSIVLFMGMQNFNGATSGDATGKLNLARTNAAGPLIGFDTNPDAGSTIYPYATSGRAMMIAVAINKNFG